LITNIIASTLPEIAPGFNPAGGRSPAELASKAAKMYKPESVTKMAIIAIEMRSIRKGQGTNGTERL
jgi:hypothetical protein